MLAVACGDDPVEPEPPSGPCAASAPFEALPPVAGPLAAADLAGRYEARTLVARPAGEPAIDGLARCGELVIDLRADGSTTGRLFVPDAGEEGGDFDAPLDGTWTLVNGNQVSFDHGADTFVRDMLFTVGVSGTDIALFGRRTFSGGATVEAVLERME